MNEDQKVRIGLKSVATKQIKDIQDKTLKTYLHTYKRSMIIRVRFPRCYRFIEKEEMFPMLQLFLSLFVARNRISLKIIVYCTQNRRNMHNQHVQFRLHIARTMSMKYYVYTFIT